jgi:hypothetical protein
MRERLAPLLFESEEWLDTSEPMDVVVPNKSQTPAKRKASFTKFFGNRHPYMTTYFLIGNASISYR